MVRLEREEIIFEAMVDVPPEAIILHKKPVGGMEGTGTSSHT